MGTAQSPPPISPDPNDRSVSKVAGDARAVRALLALATASQRLLQNQGGSPDLQSAMEHLGLSLGYRAVAVWRHEIDDPGTYTMHARWQSDSHVSPTTLVAKTAGMLDVHAAIQNGETIALLRAEAVGDQRRLFNAFPDEAILMVPIMGQEQTWGLALFAVAVGGQTSWSEQELACLRTVSAVVGGAVRRQEERSRIEALERALVENEHRRQMCTLAAGVAHDVNNLLGVMQAGVDVIEMRGGMAIPKDLKKLENAIGAAAGMVDKLYNYAGLVEREVAKVHIYALLQSTVHMLSEQLPANVTLQCRTEKDLPFISGDATQLNQVVINLVLNARDALTTTGGAIVVTAGVKARRGHTGVLLGVADDGPGIDPALRGRLFDLFVSTKGAGRGIGLANTAAIVAEHDGTLSVTDCPKGGACFEVWLPAH
jgi:signal transduction histidine kinase